MAKKVITKAVIAAAGFGTRFLPQTKAMPKEMLPLINKPIIQYVVEELVSVGVKDIIIVTGYTKRAIEDHFDRPTESLITNLMQGGQKKMHLVNEVEKISDLANFIYIRQKGVYGSATPLLNSEHLLGDEPFYYTWSDDFFISNPVRFGQMLEAYNKYRAPIISTIEVNNPDDYSKYGFCSGKEIDKNVLLVDKIVEKPGIKKAPSKLATVSGFILTKNVLKYFHQYQKYLKQGKEFYANEALNLALKHKQKMYALKIANGKYYDVGNVLDYHKTVFDFALMRKDIGPELKEYLKSKILL